MYGDTEGAKQNLQYVSNYEKTGPFRMCPQVKRDDLPEFLTINGESLESTKQKLDVDYKEKERLVCLNKDNANR
jgi:hypothetical protein